MKKFILAFRDLQSRPETLNCKLVWNPNGISYQQKHWLVTTTFTIPFIEKMGLEFIYQKQLIIK